MVGKWGAGNWQVGNWGGVNTTGTLVPVIPGALTVSLTYRALDNNYDPLWGQGQTNFVNDVNAVAQAVLTRLNLFEAEWWANTLDGLPLWQKILGSGAGVRNQQAISLLIQQRILGTPYVINLNNVQITYNSSVRAFTFYAEINTQFGVFSLTNAPAPASQALPQ